MRRLLSAYTWWIIAILAAWGEMFYRLVVTVQRLLDTHDHNPVRWDGTIIQGVFNAMVIAALLFCRPGDHDRS